MKTLLIDNYDSFTYNLYHYLQSLNCSVDVIRNDKITSNQILRKNYKKIVKSSAFCSEDNNIVSDNYKITDNEKIGIIPPIGGG